MLLAGCGVVDKVYDMQPFPLEKEPKDNLVPLQLPPVTVVTTVPATSTTLCDIHKRVCLPDVVIPTTTK